MTHRPRPRPNPRLMPNGKVGCTYIETWPDSGPHGIERSCIVEGNPGGGVGLGNPGPDNVALPAPLQNYYWYYPLAGMSCILSDNAYAFTASYSFPTNDPRALKDQSGMGICYSVFIFHDSIYDAFLVASWVPMNSGSRHEESVLPWRINARGRGWGWLIYSFDSTTYFWDGTNLSTPFGASDTPMDLNDQNEVVVSEATPGEGYLWNVSASATTPLITVLATLVQGQYHDIQPFSIGNQAAPQASPSPDKTIHILSDAQNSGNGGGNVATEKVLFKRDNAAKWSCYKIQLPAGTNITDWNTINSSGVIAAIGTPPATSSTAALLLVPVELAVDANRDGTITLSGSGGGDQTTANKPYKFWINNNQDGYSSELGETTVQDDLGPGTQDSSHNNIQCTRDLEDFARLWIDLRGSASLIKGMVQNGCSVGLQWEAIPGNTTDPLPTIKIFKAVETSGSTGYVFDNGSLPGDDNDYADQQVTGDYDVAIKDTSGSNTIVGSSPFKLPASFWNDVDDNTPKHLIFEGVTAGKGKLVLVFFDANGNKIGEGGALYMDLRDIKNMYERWSCEQSENQYGGVPTAQALPSTYRLPSGSQPFSYQKNDPEDQTYILFVHGWNVQGWEKDAFAETAFKRLWWQGYKGRFGAFQWPTTVGSLSFDDGEYTGWKSSVSLEHLLSLLDNRYSQNTVYLMAHSQGNVVGGEALRRAAQDGIGQVAADYLATQAALSVHCFDPSQPLPDGFFNSARVEWIPGVDFGINITPTGPETPNVYPNWLASTRSAASSFGNCFNVNDYALSRQIWETDQALKPDLETGPHKPYGYSGDPNAAPVEDGFKAGFNTRSSQYSLHLGAAANEKDRYEIMAFAAEPRCRALGTTSDAAGFGATDLQGLWPGDTFSQTNGAYSAHAWHSAEFRFTNGDQHSYWYSVLLELTGQKGIKP